MHSTALHETTPTIRSNGPTPEVDALPRKPAQDSETIGQRLARLRRERGITQVELAGVTGLSAATISNIVKELTVSGVLTTTPSTRSGRRAQLVTLARNLGLVAGIHFAERSLRAMLADVTQRVIAEQRMPLPLDHRADSGLDRAALLIEEMAESVGADRSELLAVGVGLPAPVDRETGTVSAHGVLRGWDWVPVAKVLGERMGVPVSVENDANLGALAEMRLGAAIGLRDVVYVRASYGIGLGLIVDGRVVQTVELVNTAKPWLPPAR